MSGPLIFYSVPPQTFEEAMAALEKAERWLNAEVAQKERYMREAALLRAILVEALTTYRPSE